MDFWKRNSRRAWIAGVLIGAACLGTGVLQGQFTVIWKKAVLICLECIGIG